MVVAVRSIDAVVVRTAGPADIDTIDGIEAESFDAADRFPRRNLKRLLASPSAAILIAEDRGRALGYVLLLFRKGAKAARLYSLAAAPSARGRGVATSLVDAAAAKALDRGCATVRLEVRNSNAAARRLYERSGFAVRKVLPAYYDDGETGLKMEKRLDEGRAGK